VSIHFSSFCEQVLDLVGNATMDTNKTCIILLCLWLLFFQFCCFGFFRVGYKCGFMSCTFFCFGGIYIFLTLEGEKIDYDNGRDCVSNHIDNNSD
jgi:hypothetical protein